MIQYIIEKMVGTYAFAAVDPGVGHLTNPLGQGSENLFQLLDKAFTVFVQVAVVFATLAIIYAGFKYVTAGGDQKAIGEAHNIFKWTVVGTLVILGARVIASVLSNTLGEVTGSTIFK